MPSNTDNFIRPISSYVTINERIRLTLVCGHKRWWIAKQIPKATYCGACKAIQETKIREMMVEAMVGMDTNKQEDSLCKHGLSKCIQCGTGRPNVTEVDLDEVPF